MISILSTQTLSEETIEKKITIMPNPAAKRGSLANFAFPELHPKVRKEQVKREKKRLRRLDPGKGKK